MRFGRTFRLMAAIGVVSLLSACTSVAGDDGQEDDGNDRDELAAQLTDLEDRVAELEEEREQLIEQRDALQDELDDVRAAQDAC